MHESDGSEEVDRGESQIVHLVALESPELDSVRYRRASIFEGGRGPHILGWAARIGDVKMNDLVSAFTIAKTISTASTI